MIFFQVALAILLLFWVPVAVTVLVVYRTTVGGNPNVLDPLIFRVKDEPTREKIIVAVREAVKTGDTVALEKYRTRICEILQEQERKAS